MAPPCEPEGLGHLLAKSAGRGAGGQAETLVAHTWAVVASLAERMRLRPGLPGALGVPRLWHLLFWAAMIHDLGKAAQGFQAMLRGGPRWVYRHEVLSLAFVDWVVGGLTRDEGLWVAAAVVSHHKDAETIAERYPEPGAGEPDPLHAVVAELAPEDVAAIHAWLATCGAVWREALGLEALGVGPVALPPVEEAVRLATRDGVARIRSWLFRYRRWMRRMADGDEAPSVVLGALALRGHLVTADHSGSAHLGPLQRVGWSQAALLASRGLHWESLHAHQCQAATTTGSAILMAPTGSGKTEAALLWAAQQATLVTGLPRLFYTLPYQASMNAMKRRLEGSFPGMVGLQHGRSLLALYREHLAEAPDPANAARAARLDRDLARLHAPPIRVFSPYQMLKGPYRLPSYEAQLSDYHGAAFVFDEIHAYEPDRLARIVETAAFLVRQFEASCFVMSATLPHLVRAPLQAALGAVTEIVAAPALFEAFGRHRLELLDGEIVAPATVGRLMADVRRGRSVLAVCNTVARAQGLYNQLKGRLAAEGIPILLLHGRFNGRDRLEKEQRIQALTGAGQADRAPLLLIATQAVEVSLDIDLDVLYSEPAPLEALVQRFGRVNRRGAQAGLAPVYVMREPSDGQRIYEPALVTRTLALLETLVGRAINEGAIGGWLDQIYAGEVATRWQQRYAEAAKEFRRWRLETLRPFQSDKAGVKAFYEAFDGIEVLPEGSYDEYLALRDTEPIRATELLVSIRLGHFKMLANRGQLKPGGDELPPVARVPYNAEVGLDLSAAPPEEEAW